MNEILVFIVTILAFWVMILIRISRNKNKVTEKYSKQSEKDREELRRYHMERLQPYVKPSENQMDKVYEILKKISQGGGFEYESEWRVETMTNEMTFLTPVKKYAFEIALSHQDKIREQIRARKELMDQNYHLTENLNKTKQELENLKNSEASLLLENRRLSLEVLSLLP